MEHLIQVNILVWRGNRVLIDPKRDKGAWIV